MEIKIITENELQKLLNDINDLKSMVARLQDEEVCDFKIYTNKSLKDLLGVQDKLLKKYRDDGLLGYHQIGDKYWYTQEDIEQFLANAHYKAYAYAG